MRKFMAVAVLIGAGTLLAQSQAGLGLIQPDAGFVFGIEWRKIVDSSIGAMMKEQIGKAQLPPIPAAAALLDTLMHDLDSVVIASSASALNKTAGATPAALVVLKGSFKPELRSLLQSSAKKSEKYRAVDILTMPQEQSAAIPSAPNQNRIAFLDEHTLLAGDIAEMRAAIDRAQSGRLTSPRRGILEGAASLAAANDLWIVFDLPANALKDAPQQAAQMFAGVKGAELGISFQQGLGLELNVRTKDDAAAATVSQALQGLVALGAMSQSQSPQAGEVLKKITIRPENSRVKLALSLDKAELERMIKEAQSSAAKAVPRTVAAPAPAPKSNQPIRITGLEGGTIEVPVVK
jgi:hypothetical protein